MTQDLIVQGVVTGCEIKTGRKLQSSPKGASSRFVKRRIASPPWFIEPCARFPRIHMPKCDGQVLASGLRGEALCNYYVDHRLVNNLILDRENGIWAENPRFLWQEYF